MNPVQPMSDAELDRLEELLDAPAFKGESLQLDELQALFCAVVSGPELVPTSVWLPAVFGGTSPGPESLGTAQAEELMGLLMRFHNEIAETLSQGHDLLLILYPFSDNPDEFDFAAWTDAYIYGSQLGCDWYAAAGEDAEDLADLLQPFFLLNGMLREDAEKHGESWLSPAQEKLVIDQAREDLPSLVVSIFDFWRTKRTPVRTVRHEAPKVGRNDDCPCGSGKKYKQCCGSPERLH